MFVGLPAFPVCGEGATVPDGGEGPAEEDRTGKATEERRVEEMRHFERNVYGFGMSKKAFGKGRIRPE